ncbi:hypothetical protein OR16_18086 [Cupriavidus basilensis OR16]|uniref:Uncharacterized protein n=1 Tax=Cupriavidus basilensis OR16 TaxID=1127483 RepID=H1S6S1_9BURK|nr:hypothetical protein [Cupriavidus basilensis]EHP41732.1 hypothetical protein OR16_18086 [Cupriavidus basilensis OR16]
MGINLITREIFNLFRAGFGGQVATGRADAQEETPRKKIVRRAMGKSPAHEKRAMQREMAAPGMPSSGRR